jgi:hypothetical protein
MKGLAMRATFFALAVVVSLGFIAPSSALAAADRTVKVTGAAPTAAWDGAAAIGLNQTFTLQEILGLGMCGKEAINYCEDTVVDVNAGGSTSAKLKVTVGGFAAVLPPPPVPASVFDVFIYKSDAAGKVGDFVGTGGEGAGTPEVVTVDKASGFYLVRVVYYAVLEAGYTGTVELIGATVPRVLPGTVPPPPGSSPSPTPSASPTPAPAPGAPATTTGKPGTLPVAGTLKISFAADKGKRKTARTRGMRIRVSCTVQCKTTATVKIDKKVAKALGLGKKAMTIGTAKASIVKPGRIPFFVKLSKKAKKALGKKKVKKFKLKVAIVVTDNSGKQLKRGTKTVTLR